MAPPEVGASIVSTVSFTTIGMPCRGERGPDSARSRSSSRARSNAFGATEMIARSAGPCRLYASILARYRVTSSSEFRVPASKARLISCTVAVRRSISANTDIGVIRRKMKKCTFLTICTMAITSVDESCSLVVQKNRDPSCCLMSDICPFHDGNRFHARPSLSFGVTRHLLKKQYSSHYSNGYFFQEVTDFCQQQD